MALAAKDFNKLVDGIMGFVTALGGINLYTYQYIFARRIVESVLKNDGATVTALWSRQCLHGNTVILDRDGSACRIKDHPRAWMTGVDMTYRVETSAGHSILASSNHPFYTKRGWVQVGDLLPDDELAVMKSWKSPTKDFVSGTVAGWGGSRFAKKRTKKVIFRWTEGIGKLLGYLTADGYSFRAVKNGQSIKFTNITPKYLAEVTQLIAEEFPTIKVKPYRKGNGFDLLLTAGKGTYKANVLRQFLRVLKDDAQFPTAIFTAPDPVALAFLNRLFAADGCASRSLQVSCGGKKTYARYVQMLLMKFGIGSVIKSEWFNGATQIFHRVDISRKEDMRQFLKIVGPIYGKEKACATLDTKMVRWSSLKETTAPEGDDGEQLVFVRLRRITPYKRVSVYDIEYPNKGWFIANGYKVHNTGKTTTVAITGVGLAVILPVLANRFDGGENEDGSQRSLIEELQQFKNGFWVGIFAPITRQANLSYAKMRKILYSKEGRELLSDPQINVGITMSRGDSLSLSHGSYVHAKTASPDSNIEGETYHLIITDESQKLDRFKVEKEIEPMLSSTNGSMIKIGTAHVSRGGFQHDIQWNIERYARKLAPRNHFEFPYDLIIAEKEEAYKRDGDKFHLNYKRHIDNYIRKKGVNSNAFRMNYMLKWQESNLDVFSAAALLDAMDYKRHLNHYEQTEFTRVAGIDVGKDNDPTVITINEVDFAHPVIIRDPVSGETTEFYHKKFVAIRELEGTFEDRNGAKGQYSHAVEFLREWDVVRSTIDATSIGDPVAERLQTLTPEIEWEFFKYTSPTKHRLFKVYIDEIESGRQKIAASSESQQLMEFSKWKEEHESLEKHYTNNNYMDCRAPEPESKAVRDAEGEGEYHDDYPNSAALAAWSAREHISHEAVTVAAGVSGGYSSGGRYSSRASAQSRYSRRR